MHQLNRHHLARSASYLRSSARMRNSLIAATAAITSTAQAANDSLSSVEMASCMAVPHEFWVDFASRLAIGFLALAIPGVLLALFLWFGVIAPWVHIRTNAAIARSDKALDAVIEARTRSRS